MTEWSQVPPVVRPLPEPEPQPVLAPLTGAAIFLVAMIEPGGETAVRDLLGEIPKEGDGALHDIILSETGE